MLCAIFSFFISMSCGAEEAPEPTPTPTPTVAPTPTATPKPDTRKTSTDGKSMWEAKYEEMCGCTFVRDPMTDAERAAYEAEKAEDEGRFIYIGP